MNHRFKRTLVLLTLGIGLVGISKILNYFDLIPATSSSTITGTGIGIALISLLWMIILKVFSHIGKS